MIAALSAVIQGLCASVAASVSKHLEFLDKNLSMRYASHLDVLLKGSLQFLISQYQV